MTSQIILQYGLACRTTTPCYTGIPTCVNFVKMYICYTQVVNNNAETKGQKPTWSVKEENFRGRFPTKLGKCVKSITKCG